jgi:hypothetical protein
MLIKPGLGTLLHGTFTCNSRETQPQPALIGKALRIGDEAKALHAFGQRELGTIYKL